MARGGQFHGTNSHDRLQGAAGVLKSLLDRGAIGLITAHDLALTSVADQWSQYFGLVVDGHRIVYVNGFHETYLKLSLEARPTASPKWRDNAVNVCDGWTLFFGAEYDPASGAIQHIRFNGRP